MGKDGNVTISEDKIGLKYKHQHPTTRSIMKTENKKGRLHYIRKIKRVKGTWGK